MTPHSNLTSLQILVRDQNDDCFGLWMIHDGTLVEVPLPRGREPCKCSVTDVLSRTYRADR